MPYTLLLVDDQPGSLQQLKTMVQGMLRCEVVTAAGGRAAIERMLLRVEPKPCLIIVNLGMADVSGIDVIRSIRCSHKSLPILAIASPATMRLAAQAIQAGACDILSKPLKAEELRVALQSHLQRMALHHEQDRLSRLEQDKVRFSDIVGSCEPLQQALAQAQRVADSAIPIVIEGERGVGKEWLARAIHGNGARAGELFMMHHCLHQDEASLLTLMHSLAEPQLMPEPMAGGNPLRRFGRGTLFLRHVEALSIEAQKSLAESVRSLQMHGRVPLRVIASSTQPLAAAVRQGFFLEDLYHSLARFVIVMPPLRARQQDIVPLAEHFARRFCAFEAKPPLALALETELALARYGWAGNIRELSQVMHRAVIQCDGVAILPSHLGLATEASIARSARTALSVSDDRGRLSLLSQEGHVRGLQEVEAEIIRYAITHYKGKMTEVARRLGIGRSTLYRKIQDYRIELRLRQAA